MVHNIPYFIKENKKDIFIDKKNVFKFGSNLKHIEVKNFIRNILEKKIEKLKQSNPNYTKSQEEIKQKNKTKIPELITIPS
ncbi:hypothetical protein J8J04_02065 ['Fragaria x ananassa' phyllody phytoplasma]|uniref:Uncharacterized protein n=1 Tax='Fragaria x ananassa' phyllody phytoplasma TaxID=2358428 RepID=A0ABS5K3K8_9MOLU|nr:hypothetical protein ['Fragaria x ananassa' phyllody phytoplasma]MBS2126468.1 hypothetical protein ['Fragaria x ananassa' phyllody phytoplasma]